MANSREFIIEWGQMSRVERGQIQRPLLIFKTISNSQAKGSQTMRWNMKIGV